MDASNGWMSRASSIVDVLERRGDLRSAQPGYVFLSEGAEVDRLTFGELQRRARALAAYLQKIKVQNERALLLYPAGLDYVVALYGCLYGQAIAVPAYPPRKNQNLGRLLAIIEDAKPAVALTTAAAFSRLQDWFNQAPGLKSLQWVITDNITQGLADSYKESAADKNTIALLQYTSGSTSTPKGVLVSHGNLLHNQAMMRERLRHDDDSVIVSWLPMYHDMGLIGNILAGIYNGVPCYLMAHTDFLQKPVRWLEAISKYRATFSGGPNFAYDLCARKTRPEQREGLDLSAWRTAFNGSEPVRAETMNRFTEAFSGCGFRPEAHYPCYGLAEATLFVSGGEISQAPIVTPFDKAELEEHRAAPGDPLRGGTMLVSSGKECHDERILIVDPQTSLECKEGRVGEIWLSSAAVARGYWGSAGLTDETFRARLADTGEGPFLRTGDLGVVIQGELYVTGRIKDLIVVRGRNHYPQDIELTAEASHQALRSGATAAFAVAGEESEKLILVAEIDRERRRNLDINEVMESVRKAILIEHEIDLFAIVLIRPGSLPKTSSGKIQRGAVRAAFLSDRLAEIDRRRFTAAREAKEQNARPEIALQTLGSLKDWLLLECSSKMNVSPHKMDADQPIACHGLDSLAATELVISIEEAFGVQAPIDMLFRGAPSVSDLALFLYEQLQPTQPDRDERSDRNERRKGEVFEERPSILPLYEPAPGTVVVAA